MVLSLLVQPNDPGQNSPPFLLGEHQEEGSKMEGAAPSRASGNLGDVEGLSQSLVPSNGKTKEATGTDEVKVTVNCRTSSSVSGAEDVSTCLDQNAPSSSKTKAMATVDEQPSSHSSFPDACVLRMFWPEDSRADIEASMFSAVAGESGVGEFLGFWRALSDNGEAIASHIFLPSNDQEAEQAFYPIFSRTRPVPEGQQQQSHSRCCLA